MRVFKWAFLSSALVAAPVLAQVPAGGEFRVNTHTPNQQQSPGGAFAADGRFTITWTSNLQDAFSFGIYAQRYAPDGSPAGGEFLVPTVTSAVEALSSVAYSPGGNSMIVWHGAGSPGFDIRAQRYAPNGTPRGGEFVVNTYTAANEYTPDVAPLPGGGFVVAWTGYGTSPSFHRILAQRYDAFGVRLGQELQVTPIAPGLFTSHPSIASGADGRFVVVWKQSAAPTFGIAARVYDASGNPMGPQFFVESTPTSADQWPQVTMAGDGTFVVVWEGINDGSLYGIRGRRFSRPARRGRGVHRQRHDRGIAAPSRGGDQPPRRLRGELAGPSGRRLRRFCPALRSPVCRAAATSGSTRSRPGLKPWTTSRPTKWAISW